MPRRPRRLTVELDGRDAEWLALHVQQLADLAESLTEARRLDRITRALSAAAAADH